MVDLMHADGFLGTNANLAADINLIIMLLIAALFTFGAYLAAVRKNYEVHRWVQTAGVLLTFVFIGWLMILPFRDFVIQDLGGPRTTIFYAVTWIHAITGFFASVLGVWVILRGNNLMPIPALKFNNYKPYMRWAYGLYMVTMALGVALYFVWFVVEPNTPEF